MFPHRNLAANKFPWENSSGAELSMGWVDPWVGLSWVGLGRHFSVFGGLGSVGSTIGKVLTFSKIALMQLKHG